MNLLYFTFKAMMRLLALLSITFLFSACKEHDNSEITRVEFAKSTCYGPCVPTAISLDSTLNYQFYADSTYVKRAMAQRSYRGKISRLLWNELTSKLEDVDYKHLHKSNGVHIADLQSVELVIYWGKHKTHLETAMSSHTEVGKVLYWIDSTYKKVKLMPATDSLRFNTILQLDPRITHHQ